MNYEAIVESEEWERALSAVRSRRANEEPPRWGKPPREAVVAEVGKVRVIVPAPAAQEIRELSDELPEAGTPEPEEARPRRYDVEVDAEGSLTGVIEKVARYEWSSDEAIGTWSKHGMIAVVRDGQLVSPKCADALRELARRLGARIGPEDGTE